MQQDDIDARKRFLSVLEWLLAVTKRYPQPLQFGLAHIGYENPKLLGETYGAKKASQQLDEVSRSLREAFRKTDLVARDGVDFWIIVPFTPNEEKISDKIEYILETARLAGLRIVERNIAIFSLPLTDLPVDDDISPADLLKYLKKNHARFAHRNVTLPADD